MKIKDSGERREFETGASRLELEGYRNGHIVYQHQIEGTKRWNARCDCGRIIEVYPSRNPTACGMCGYEIRGGTTSRYHEGEKQKLRDAIKEGRRPKIPCLYCRFSKIDRSASMFVNGYGRYTARECTNLDSDYFKALLNVTPSGDPAGFITWGGCQEGSLVE